VNKSPHLETRRIRLRQIGEGDFHTLFKWRNTEKFRIFLHHHTNEISFEEFCGEFERDSEAYKYQYLIEKKDRRAPVGFTYVDTFSEQYKSCFINLFIDERFEGRGYGIDAYVCFVLFLFQQEGLQKLFAHAFDFNYHSISVIKNLGMRQLQGNITKINRQGKERSILCFAADQSIVPRLTCINEYLSEARPQIAFQQNF
jgi:RimJ/RimL family protein N-acetyltransferase